MTRVTAPMSKLARSLASTPSVARPHNLSGASNAGAVLARAELSADGRSSGDYDSSSRRSLTTAHRPVTAQPNPNRTIPLMQGFHTSSPRAAPLKSSGPDITVFPSLAESDDQSGALMMMRVPLLPDNFAPDRSAFAAEAVDPPLAAPVINILGERPAEAASALTEIEGMGVDGIELKFVHARGTTSDSESYDEQGGGMLRGVWNGMLDDVFGGAGARKASA